MCNNIVIIFQTNVNKEFDDIVYIFQTKRGKKDDDGLTQDEGAADGDAAPAKKQKKKRSKGAIAANPEVFNGEFDSNDCIGKTLIQSQKLSDKSLVICYLLNP